MRKIQAEIIEKAKKRNFTQSQIALLSREDFTAAELQHLMRFFSYRCQTVTGDIAAVEAECSISFLKERKTQIATTKDYEWLLYVFLPASSDFDLPDNMQMRIYKMYLFLLDRAKKNSKNAFDISIIHNYVFMLENSFPLWHRTTLLRMMIQDEDKVFHLRSLYQEYPFLLDDYLNNRKESLLYYVLVEINSMPYFRIKFDEFADLYDPLNHRFLFSKEEFPSYFKIVDGYHNYYELNADYITQKKLGAYPLIGLISEFCKNSKILIPKKEETSFTIYETRQLTDNDMANRLRQCFDILGRGFTTKAQGFRLSVTISSSFFVSISYAKYHSVYYGLQGKHAWCFDIHDKPTTYEIIIAPDGNLFTKTKANKNIPLSMKMFAILRKEQNVFGEILDLILKDYQRKNIFYRNVIADSEKFGCLMPLSFNEVINYHNRSELIQKKYKTAEAIKINWNKLNLNLSYLIIKAYPLLDYGISREILTQQRDISLVEEVVKGSWSKKDYAHDFLKEIIKRNVERTVPVLTSAQVAALQERCRREIAEEYYIEPEYIEECDLTDEVEFLLKEYMNWYDPDTFSSDYIRMCQRSKVKIRLDIRSFRQLQNLHDQIATDPERYKKMTGKVKVPARSKFLPLRKKLPPEFEWIKTRKRLIQETTMQQHCVWSYADAITEDRCAIYSFLDARGDYARDGKPRRYTVEFRQAKNGKYFVQQVQGRYNKVNANGMREYVQSLLDGHS